MASDDRFKGLNDGIQRQAEMASEIGRNIDAAREAEWADEARKHDEIVKASTDLAELLDDVAAATMGVGNSVRQVEDAVRHVEEAVGAMRQDVRDALGEVTSAVVSMNEATTRLMWVSIGVASIAILATVLTAVF